MIDRDDTPVRSDRTDRTDRPRFSERSTSSSSRSSSTRSTSSSSSSSGSEKRPRSNPYATLRALKWLVGLALVLSIGCLVAIAIAISTAGNGPAATTAELQGASTCAKAKLVGEYVRLKMTANLRGTQPLRHGDVVAAEQGCENDASVGDVNLLIEQANALNVPGLAPAAQAPAPQPPQAQQ